MSPDSLLGAKLKELIDGNSQLAYDPDKTEQELWNAAPGNAREIATVVAAQRLGVPWELLNAGAEPDPALVERLSRDVEEQTQMPAAAARWAVQTWAFALDIPLPTPVEGPDHTYLVLDGVNRYGPAAVSLLNEWSRQGRLHPGMRFEDQQTGQTLSPGEIPGLTLDKGDGVAPPIEGAPPPQATPFPSDTASNYFRPDHQPLPVDLRRMTDWAVAKAILALALGCLFVPPLSLLNAFMARAQFRRGNHSLAWRLARSANLWANIAILASAVYWAVRLYQYFVNHQPLLWAA